MNESIAKETKRELLIAYGENVRLREALREMVDEFWGTEANPETTPLVLAKARALLAELEKGP